jgi:hypothetical protein
MQSLSENISIQAVCKAFKNDLDSVCSKHKKQVNTRSCGWNIMLSVVRERGLHNEKRGDVAGNLPYPHRACRQIPGQRNRK